MSTFADQVRSAGAAESIAAHLDGLAPDLRVKEVLDFPAGLMASLFERVAGCGVSLQDFVDVTEQTVIYELKNNLPVFSISQKRFYRPASGDVVGYNHTGGLAARFAGPGYFYVEDGDDGELLFDYTRSVTFRPPGWPEPRPNTGLIPGITYGNMIDRCRRVSKDTVIGAAYKGGKSRNAYFLLTRQNPT